MTDKSLTSSESFAARLLRSERWRIWLTAAAMFITLIGVILRRILGGAVMTVNSVFVPSICVLLFGLLYQCIMLFAVRIRARRGVVIPLWQRLISVTVDLLVPYSLLLILQIQSPARALASLSAPSLLLVPLVILLSTLRLRPLFSFWTGLYAALFHLALTLRAIGVGEVFPDEFPVLLSYSVLLAMTGAAAAVVSSMARKYVIETVDEATALHLAEQNVSTIKQDLRIARDIQIGLLPLRSPPIAGFDVAGMARPAEFAGGDYYDWQPLPDGQLVVAIADVTGHGIGPALVMAVCRAYARAAAPTSEGPHTLIERLNDLIVEDLKGARFITMAMALVNPNGTVGLISAGHGPTLLFHAATSEIEWFGGDGLPLGIISNQPYGPLRTLQMQPGDILFMLTDGFFEHARASDSEMFGLERVKSVLREKAGRSAADIIAYVDRAVTEFAGGSPQTDDMTAVIIKRL